MGVQGRDLYAFSHPALEEGEVPSLLLSGGGKKKKGEGPLSCVEKSSPTAVVYPRPRKGGLTICGRKRGERGEELTVMSSSHGVHGAKRVAFFATIGEEKGSAGLFLLSEEGKERGTGINRAARGGELSLCDSI